jgi:hypothetical protein
MKFYERFWKYMPYISASVAGLGALGKGVESLTGLAGWLSGETYTGLPPDPSADMSIDPRITGSYTDRGVGGAFGGFESTSRDWLRSKGWNTAGTLVGHTVNLLGEILSAPVEAGLRTRDVIERMKSGIPKGGFLKGTVLGDIGEAYVSYKAEKEAAKDKDGKGGRERVTHRQIPYGSPAQARKLSQARKLAHQQRQQNYYGGVYDPKVAQLMQYAFHELNPTIIAEMKKTQLARSYYDVGSAAIGRGRGIG